MAVSAGMEDFALLLGILGIVGPIIVGIIAAAVSAKKAERRREEAKLKHLQKEEEARHLAAERQAAEKRKLEEETAARLQEEQKREERRQQIEQEQAAKRLEGERKRRLAREVVEVTEQWEAQDKKGQPRNPTVMAMIKIQHERAQQESDPDVKAWLIREIEQLQKLNNTGERETGRAEPKSAEQCIRELAEIVRTAFLVKSCPRCHENRMALIEVSPNAKSIEYVCTYCAKRQRAAANSPEAQKVKDLEGFIIATLGKVWFKTVKNGYRCTFSVPEATLPYEQTTTRGQIAGAIRGQVWRRDNGKCAQCGSRENLQFDHIVPVSKGGATSVSNLQLLCQSCNLSKGAKI